MSWYLGVLKKYAVFTGRARRKEYWFFALFHSIASVSLILIDNLIGTYDPTYALGLLSGIYTLAVLIPALAVAVRRLHDIDRSGWWILIALVPLIGSIVLLVFLCLDSSPGKNRYDADPKIMNHQIIGMVALIRKETRRVLRIWVQTIIPPGITMSLYFIIFGTLIGRRIGQMDGFQYMEYIAPGLIMMSVITNSYGNVVGSFFNAKIQRHIEEMLVSPMSEISIVIGYLAGGIIRGIFVAAVVSLIALFFTQLNIQHPVLAILVIVMTAGVFSLAGLLNAIFAKKFDDIAIIPSFVLAPLTYLGGVFYTITLLPEFWQKVSYFNPILYMVNAMRFSVLGESDIDIFIGILVILAFFIMLLCTAIYLLKKGVGIRE